MRLLAIAVSRMHSAGPLLSLEEVALELGIELGESDEPDLETRMLPTPDLVTRLVERTGGTRILSKLLGVTERQVSRWRRGEQRPSSKNGRVLSGLDQVLAAAAQLWQVPTVVVDWLLGTNAYLHGATPIDVLRLRGAAEVLDAIEAAKAGAYA